MALGKNTAVVNELQTLFNVGVVRELSDGQLLERFAIDRSEAAELAFAVLVERHGPMVLRVCGAVLADPHDTEDAFQATFLVLVKKARGLWVRDSLGPWLHQVAYRTASCARLAGARRRRHERLAAAAQPEIHTVNSNHLESLLHEEIERLPERYRAPVVLCDLEGRTHQQAARHLGWPVGTVKSRQARGRERLRERLRRRGLAPNAGLLGTGFVLAGPDPVVPAALVDSTIRSVVQFVTCRTAVPASTLSLVQGVLKAMSFTRWSKIASILVVLSAALTGAGVFAQRKTPAAQPRPANEIAAARAGDLITFQARPGSLAVTVAGRGSLESAANHDVYSLVEGTTTILQILPEGTRVKKGQIVCELDSAPLRDRLVNQQIATRTAEAAYQNAKITVEVAELALKEYAEGSTLHELKALKAEIGAAQTAVGKAEVRLERVRRAQSRLSDALVPGQNAMIPADIVAQLDIEDRLDATEETLARARTTLELAKSKQDLIENYTRPKAAKALQADVERKRADALATTATSQLERSKERKLEVQIAACKIYAPADGLVVYANDPYRDFRQAQFTIGEGSTVRNKQKIFSLPDISRMQVNARIPESEIDKVAHRMKVRIRVDAFADQALNGTVSDIAALPESRVPGSKVFTTRIKIENPIAGLRPGMTAQIEILVAKRDDVLSVPIQAIIRYQGKDHVAVQKPGGGIEWRDVTLGISNDKFVEVTYGISSGDTVVLNPTSLLSDEERRDRLGAPSKASAPR
jgi:HlyD family secretion protein